MPVEVVAVRAPAEVAAAVLDAVGRRDADGIIRYADPGMVDDFVVLGEFKGHGAVRGFFEELFAGFPDLQVTVDRIVADGGSAAVQWHAEGTFSGTAFQGVKATGRRVAVRGVDVMEIADGLVQRNTVYYDGAAFARQVGLLPARGSRADRALLAMANGTTSLKRRLRRG
jgi:steroid delta-isomerase-like uncharacterized protein